MTTSLFPFQPTSIFAVVNATGANTLDVLYNGKFEGVELRWNKGNPDIELIERYYSKMQKDGMRPKTKATAIQIGKPVNLLKGLRALEFTNGVVLSVEDKEMLDGMSVVGLNGFDCEMASGAVPAGIKKLLDEEEKVLDYLYELSFALSDYKYDHFAGRLNPLTRGPKTSFNYASNTCINNFKDNIACGQYSIRARTIDMYLSIISGNEISSIPDDPSDNPDKGRRFLTHYNSTMVLRNL